MSAEKSKSDKILLNLLRQKQKKDGISYITTKSISYKIVRFSFLAVMIICLAINIIYLLGVSGQLNANLQFAEELMDFQKEEIAEIRASIKIVGFLTVALFLGEVAIWFKQPILQILFTVIPGIAMIFHFESRLSDTINDGDSAAFTYRHLIPLIILCLLCLISAGLHLRQKIKDKRGCREISEMIYEKYQVLAKDITEEQWETVLEEYQPAVTGSKKRSVRKRKEKESLKVAEKGSEPTDE